MVSLKKQNLKASEYAKRTVQELFPPEIFENTIMKTSVTGESVVALNDGNGKFRIVPLPNWVQLSCVCGIACTDLNNDGKTDLILGGNNFEFRPQYSRIDANYGSVLLNQGEGNFSWVGYNKSGFFIREEIKHIGQFKDSSGKRYIVTAINDGTPRMHQIDE
jgi:hypothetical protein